MQRRTGRELIKPDGVEMESWGEEVGEGMWEEWLGVLRLWGEEKETWEVEREGLRRRVLELEGELERRA